MGSTSQANSKGKPIWPIATQRALILEFVQVKSDGQKNQNEKQSEQRPLGEGIFLPFTRHSNPQTQLW
jgi:hypothetical protein